MHKITLLTITAASLMPLNCFSSEKDHTTSPHNPRKSARCHAPQLHYTAEYGGGPVFTDFIKNEAIRIHPSCDSNSRHIRKRTRSEEEISLHNIEEISLHNIEEISLHNIVERIKTNPNLDYFESAFITIENKIYCPTTRLFFSAPALSELIKDVEDLMDPNAILPPSDTTASQVLPPTPLPISLVNAQALLEKLNICAEGDCLNLAETQIQAD